MIVAKSTSIPVVTEADVVKVRQAVRGLAVEIKLSLVDQTKVVTAASELGRNLLIYGGGGVIIPFIGIKALDLLITALHLA